MNFDSWLDQYAIWEGGRRVGDEWEEFRDEHAGAELISIEDATTCSAIARAVKLNPVAAEYFSEGEAEVSVKWDSRLGMPCKSRLDWVNPGLVLDLKSTRDASHRKFASQAASLSYHAQLAFYHDAAKAVDGLDRKCVIVAVEKVPPYEVGTYVVPDEAIKAGRLKYEGWMRGLVNHLASCKWPGVCPVETELYLPQYIFDEADEEELTLEGEIVT